MEHCLNSLIVATHQHASNPNEDNLTSLKNELDILITYVGDPNNLTKFTTGDWFITETFLCLNNLVTVSDALKKVPVVERVFTIWKMFVKNKLLLRILQSDFHVYRPLISFFTKYTVPTNDPMAKQCLQLLAVITEGVKKLPLENCDKKIILAMLTLISDRESDQYQVALHILANFCCQNSSVQQFIQSKVEAKCLIRDLLPNLESNDVIVTLHSLITMTSLKLNSEFQKICTDMMLMNVFNIITEVVLNEPIGICFDTAMKLLSDLMSSVQFCTKFENVKPYISTVTDSYLSDSSHELLLKILTFLYTILCFPHEKSSNNNHLLKQTCFEKSSMRRFLLLAISQNVTDEEKSSLVRFYIITILKMIFEHFSADELVVLVDQLARKGARLRNIMTSFNFKSHYVQVELQTQIALFDILYLFSYKFKFGKYIKKYVDFKKVNDATCYLLEHSNLRMLYGGNTSVESELIVDLLLSILTFLHGSGQTTEVADLPMVQKEKLYHLFAFAITSKCELRSQRGFRVLMSKLHIPFMLIADCVTNYITCTKGAYSLMQKQHGVLPAVEYSTSSESLTSESTFSVLIDELNNEFTTQDVFASHILQVYEHEMAYMMNRVKDLELKVTTSTSMSNFVSIRLNEYMNKRIQRDIETAKSRQQLQDNVKQCENAEADTLQMRETIAGFQKVINRNKSTIRALIILRDEQEITISHKEKEFVELINMREVHEMKIKRAGEEIETLQHHKTRLEITLVQREGEQNLLMTEQKKLKQQSEQLNWETESLQKQLEKLEQECKMDTEAIQKIQSHNCQLKEDIERCKNLAKKMYDICCSKEE